MLTYTITGDTITISDRVRSYIEKRFNGFGRFVAGSHPQEIIVTVSKDTAHERADSVRVDVQFKLHLQNFFASGVAGDIMAATDIAKEELMREVTHSKAKRQTLFVHGARKLKSLLKNGFGQK